MSRSQKIFRLWHASYKNILDSAYQKDPTLIDQSFETQLSRFFADKTSYSNYFAVSMRALGHEIMEVVFDLEPAQKAWARDKGELYDEENWDTEILFAQIADYRPEVVYLHSLVSTPMGFADEVKKRYPFVKLVVGFAGIDAHDRQISGLDLLLVGVPHLQKRYSEKGMTTHLVYHGFDTAILEELKTYKPLDTERYEFTFVGSSGFGYHHNFSNRFWALAELIMRSDLCAWVNDNQNSLPHVHKLDWSLLRLLLKKFEGQVKESGNMDMYQVYISKYISTMQISSEVMDEFRTYVIADTGEKESDPLVPFVPLCQLLPDKCKPPVFGLEMYDLLSRSNILFNIHTNLTRGESANMRLFESTGIGTCLMTEESHNIGDLFVPDSEVVTYTSVDDCLEKVKFLKENPNARHNIARAGQARTLRDHTGEKRCAQIDRILQEYLN